MTGLWTNDRDSLGRWLAGFFGVDVADGEDAADDLINDGVVRVLNPDDTELVERVAKAMWSFETNEFHRDMARAVIVALRQP
jgi:hypothetical protein